MKKCENITSVILSGGKSSRIGTNKSFLIIDGKSLIQRLSELLESFFQEVVISSNEPELYEYLEKKIIKDIFPGRGPLSGIHSVLSFSSTEKNFVISCDLPFISSELINYLINISSDADVLLPKADGRIQPLCGIYSKSVLLEAENLLIESSNSPSNLKGSVHELLNRVKTEFLNVDQIDFYHPNLFMNINTLDDFNLAKSILEKK